MPHRKISVGGTAVLVVLALFGAVAFASVSRLSLQQQAVVDTNIGITSVQELLVASYEIERAGSAYLQSGSAASLDLYNDARNRIETALDDLRRRAEDRPRQRAVLDTLGQMIGTRVNDLGGAISMKKRQGQGTAIQVSNTPAGREHRSVLPLIQKMRDEELVVLAERTRLMSREGQASRMVVLGGSIIAFLVASLVLVPARPSEM